MIQQYTTQSGEAQFNAGVAISRHINAIFEAATQSRLRDDFVQWHSLLDEAEIKMFPKFRNNAEAIKEVKELKDKYKRMWYIYMIKVMKNKRIPQTVVSAIKEYLTEYEKCLLYWRDKFGYGMPSKLDPRYAL